MWGGTSGADVFLAHAWSIGRIWGMVSTAAIASLFACGLNRCWNRVCSSRYCSSGSPSDRPLSPPEQKGTWIWRWRCRAPWRCEGHSSRYPGDCQGPRPPPVSCSSARSGASPRTAECRCSYALRCRNKRTRPRLTAPVHQACRAIGCALVSPRR